MIITSLSLQDFRSYEQFEVSLDGGLTAIVGSNGIGKTNLVEAIDLLGGLKSFRGAPTESLIRRSAERAYVRAKGTRDDREVLIEIELGTRIRAQVNRQKLKRARDLLGVLRTTVFAPEDLALVKEGPALRREYLDDLAVALDPQADAIQRGVERTIRQRNALLRSCGGRLDESATATLDVWDDKLASLGTELTELRVELVEQITPYLCQAYDVLANPVTEPDGDPAADAAVRLRYIRSWQEASLRDALAAKREVDLKRAVTSAGPHRDDIEIRLNGLSSRTEASQGEQRSLALAMRLAGHRLVTEKLKEAPLLLLDDVLSELDHSRSQALLSNLPAGQTVLTSAVPLPPEVSYDALIILEDNP